MKIIVIGMDNTGKTTLCRELSSRMNLDWIHSLGPKHSKEELSEYLVKNLRSNSNCIFERFSFFDEIVYGTVLRGESKFSFKDELFNIIKEVKPIIIYCRPDISAILDWQGREQMEGVIEDSNRLITAWDLLIDKVIDSECYCKYLIWDYKNDTIDNMIEKIEGKNVI